MKITSGEPSSYHRFGKVSLGILDRIFCKTETESDGLNQRMFEEDFARVFNYTGGNGAKTFDILSNDDDLTERLFSNVRIGYGRDSADETVRRLVEEIAQSLVCSGAAYYSLKNDVDSDDIYIASFGPSGVIRLFGMLIQWVPKHTVEHWGRDSEEVPREIRVLDSARVMSFVMPITIKRMLSAQKKTLAVIDRHQFGVTDFQSQATHENPNPINHFDFHVWRDAQEYAFYRCTRATGWNGRKSDFSKRSDFFDCHRLIRFRRNQILLRDDILRQLGVELSRVGKGYNAEFAVEIFGTDQLSTVAYLDELEARLTREEAGFSEIIDYCFRR